MGLPNRQLHYAYLQIIFKDAPEQQSLRSGQVWSHFPDTYAELHLEHR